MAVYRSMISSFLIFAGVVLVIDGYDWDLSSNWTSEIQCPQILVIYCAQSNLKSELLQWKANGNIFTNYTYKDSDTNFPIKLNSSIEGFEVTIIKVSVHELLDTYTINSSLIAQSDIFQNYETIECDNGDARGSIKVNFNCVDVYLQVNDTVEGEICPDGLNFSSIAMNVESIVWYLGKNELTNYTVNSKSTQPLDLCTQKEKNVYLTDLCDNGGSLTINEVTRNGSCYNVISTVILTGTYIFDQQYLYVESGSNNITKSVPTNFTLTCGSEDLNITSNITNIDCDSCDNIIAEFVCVGNDVPNFFWVFNRITSMLSPNYTYSPSSIPVIVNATILDLKIPISADTNNCLDKHFNFESKLTVSMSDLNKMRIKRIGCVADDLQRWTAVNSNNGNWTVNSNWTSEMQCPQILEINFYGINLENSLWQWKAGDNKFADYIYNDIDEFPIKLNSSIEGLEVTILYVSEDDDTYIINSTLVAESDIILNYEDIECVNGNSKGSIKVDFNCVDVYLQVNDTVEGEVCPAGLNFSSIAMNVESIVWYLGENELINYPVNSESTPPLDLCATQEKNDYLTDLCDNGGSLTIDKINRNGSRYDVISTVILTGTYIFYQQYLYVESGSNNITKTVPTNFTLVCGCKHLHISSNITYDDSGSCDDIVEFVCVGTDVPYFFWFFNDETSMLSPNYTYSPSSFPVFVNATILDLKIPISADTNDTLDQHFNFESAVTVSMANLNKMGIKSIGCVTDDRQNWTAVNCESPWCHYLFFLDELPFCNICEDNAIAECLGILGGALAVLLLDLFFCIYIGHCCYRYRKKKKYRKSKLIEDAESKTNQISGNVSTKPNEDTCIAFEQSPKEHKRKWKTLFKKKKTSETRALQVDGSDALKEQKQSSVESKLEGFKFVGAKQGKKSKTESGLMGASPPTTSPASSRNNSLKTLPTDSPKISNLAASPAPVVIPTPKLPITPPAPRPITPPKSRPSTPPKPRPSTPPKPRPSTPPKSRPSTPPKPRPSTPPKPRPSTPPKPRPITPPKPKPITSPIPRPITPPIPRPITPPIPRPITPPKAIPPLPDPDQPVRDEERRTAENIEREKANRLSQGSFPEFIYFNKLNDLGSRLQKFWYIRKSKDRKTTAMQFTVKISRKCPISLEGKDVAVLKEFFSCLKHPSLLPILDVVRHEDFISILQEFVESGSIRDILFGADPKLDWEKKYESKSKLRLRPEQIATCSRDILEAVFLLYDLGFPCIGQIHCGNVFLKEKRYFLGGFENVLLGYRTSVYSHIVKNGLLNVIDVIMFGRMIYEIATGVLLPDEQLLLDESHFTTLKDSNVRGFLEFIFSEELLARKDPMTEIFNHQFIENVKRTEKPKYIELTPDAKALLSRITEKQTSEPEEKPSRDLDIVKIEEHLKSKYSDMESCATIGWRQNKVWAKAIRRRDKRDGLLSAVKIPYTCPVYVQAGLSAIKSILKRNESFLVSVRDVHHLKIGEDHVLVIFQEIFDKGSLKDKVHGCSPWNPWEHKYSQGHPLPKADIASFGNQILKIAIALGSMDGGKSSFKLQFLHTGNIFFRTEDSILVAGLENLLIGCRPRDYVKYRDHMESIDTLMFGHLIYELASGREIKALFPSEKEYKNISYKNVKDVLKTIFENPTMNLKQILDLKFFSPHPTSPLDFKINDNTTEMMVLEHVRKGKWRDQDAKLEKAKYELKKIKIVPPKFRKIFHL